MDFKSLIESADIEINEILDYLAECLQNHDCLLMTKIILGQILMEIKKSNEKAIKNFSKMIDEKFGRED